MFNFIIFNILLMLEISYTIFEINEILRSYEKVCTNLEILLDMFVILKEYNNRREIYKFCEHAN